MRMTKRTVRRPALWIFLWLITVIPAVPGCTKTQQVLTHEPTAPQQSLEGRWDLKSYGPASSQTPVLPDAPVFVVFTPEGGISGSGGCNRYVGGWGFVEGDRNLLRIWRTGSTKMACEVPLMTQEHRYLEELGRVSGYSTDGGELRLFYDGGKGVLRFTRGTNP